MFGGVPCCKSWSWPTRSPHRYWLALSRYLLYIISWSCELCESKLCLIMIRSRFFPDHGKLSLFDTERPRGKVLVRCTLQAPDDQFSRALGVFFCFKYSHSFELFGRLPPGLKLLRVFCRPRAGLMMACNEPQPHISCLLSRL